ncbi:MAG: AraC-like DNA-binding protein [Candidatus Pelagisphaera sp.]|jgi:AraC-like DNA-binding protein
MYHTRADLAREEASISVYDIDSQKFSDSLHCHDRDEILLVTNGSGKWRIGELEGSFNSGALSYTRAGTLHAFQSIEEGGSAGRVSAIALQFPREALPKEFLDLREATVVREFFNRVGKGAFVHLREFDRIRARLRTILGSKGMLRIARTHALFDLLAQLDGWQVDDNQSLSVRKRSDRARLKAVYQHVDGHFSEPVSRDEVAELVGMEANSFSRFFARANGQTFSDYLAVIRVRHAATLLGLRRGVSIARISRESGFRNLSVFNRQFRKRLGVTPAAYRKQQDSEALLV